ncbi:hypothetical protein GcM3_184036 [Golovinomyces cichoracearum]|uniref:Uncharacterized protein n=1 Tax=Golovinomyces cichoracearum TaxID=62708 RepID=A0A420HKT9_9PEZI|nr:hypothetical protein GcM3_184036 [Golovinomyces cichoracearum]
MDSPSIRRIENGQNPEWTSEELRQIRVQKRQQKQAEYDPSKSIPYELKKIVGRKEYYKSDPLEDVSYDANQQIQDEEKRQDEIRRLRLVEEERRRVFKEEEEHAKLSKLHGISDHYTSVGRITIPYLASNDVRNTWGNFDRSNHDTKNLSNQRGRRPRFESQPEVNENYHEKEN